ncbi:AraC family transcriptional regulator [Photobacterium sagamiensis]|uniref:AraC family transcriptional regulator n=1 Tax=Photobacterium sagamiensis TaxID=2910241 RepID=UPI003D11552E
MVYSGLGTSIESIEFQNVKPQLDINIYRVAELIAARGKGELCSPHRIDFYTFVLVTHGTGVHYIDHHMYHCRPGSLLVTAPFQVHCFDTAFEWDGLVIAFDSAELFSASNELLNARFIETIGSINYIANLSAMCQQDFANMYLEYKNNTDSVTILLLRNMLQNIILKVLYRHNLPAQQDCLRHVSVEFHQFNQALENYYFRYHNVTDYSRLLRCSTKKLNNLARAETGMSAKELIDSRVLLEAKRLLSHTIKPISEIAVVLGFEEQTNLAKFFRRHTSCSPTEFRSVSHFYRKFPRS